jgi:hypothetical protein
VTEGSAAPPAWRYERKLVVDDLAPAQVEALVRLHPALFRAAYPPRWVNNVYLDTAALAAFHDNQDGLARRRKVRVRWYGELLGRSERPRLELKEKRGLAGAKRGFELPPFELAPGFAAAGVRALLARAALPDDVRAILAPLEPRLVNRYRRAYYVSADGRFRLTLDTRLEFRPLQRLWSSLVQRSELRDLIVIELKYALEHDDDAARVVSALPFRVTRSSKFAAPEPRAAHWYRNPAGRSPEPLGVTRVTSTAPGGVCAGVRALSVCASITATSDAGCPPKSTIGGGTVARS